MIPSGFIGLWSGSVASIPSGWHLCDGTTGTPDLRDNFVIGAGGARTPGATGGAASVTAFIGPSDFQAALNNYLVLDPVGDSSPTAAVNVFDNTFASTSPVPTRPFSVLPPYYALCYIMKL